MASWCLELAQVQRPWGWGARNNYRFLKHQALPDTSTRQENCSLWELNGEAERPSDSPLFLGHHQCEGVLLGLWALRRPPSQTGAA